MSQTYFRSYNPVWNFRDLTGLPLDDTYYCFFLENTIPYYDQAVYHTPTSTPWSNPVQLTAAGTLPVDVYFQIDKTYRIEIRAGNTQADALIWLIENYTTSNGGDTPITDASVVATNQITNPQFSLISFEDSLSISSSGTYEVAPGWDLVLTGSGTVTVTREALSSTSTNPTNAPYALRLAVTGWTERYLRQRFEKNGMLWAEQHVSSSITAKVDSINANISATLFDSNGTELAEILPTSQLTSDYEEFTFVTPAPLAVSTNPDVPPAAYIEYRLILPAAIDIYLSSVQVVPSAAQLEYQYEQDTIERQVDHTFHIYKDSILLQPKDSILTGWDFGLNPWQFSDTAAANVATNEYRGDQTLVIQQQYVDSASGNNVSVSRGTLALNYGYTVQAVTSTNQFALLQYIAPQSCRPYWKSKLSCLVQLNARKQSSVANIRVKARIIYKAGLPAVTAQAVPISSWTAGQDPTSYSAGVTAIAPKNDPAYNLSNGDNTLTFEGFDLTSVPSTDANMTMGLLLYTIDDMIETGTADNITFQSVNLVPNDFAIEANALSFDETLRKCQYYFEMSYPVGTGSNPAGTADNNNAVMCLQNSYAQVTVGAASFLLPSPFSFRYLVPKNIAPHTVTVYSANAGTTGNVSANLFYFNAAGNYSNTTDNDKAVLTWWSGTSAKEGYNFVPTVLGNELLTIASSTTVLHTSGYIRFNYMADARLGLV